MAVVIKCNGLFNSQHQLEHETKNLHSSNTYPVMLSFLLKKLTLLGWEVKRKKECHQEPQKFDMVWAWCSHLV